MSWLDWLFGDDDPDPVQTTSTSTATQSVPEYISGPHEQAIAKAGELASQDYTPFPGQQVAGFTQDQTGSFQDIRDAQGIGIGQMAPAYGAAIGATGAISSAERDQYFNPYIQNVGRRTEDEMRRQQEMKRNAIAGQAQRAGAFGGARHGIVDAEQNRNFQRNLGDMYAGVYGKGFDFAQQAAQDVRTIGQRGAATAGQLAGQAQNMRYQDTAQQLGIGQLQQQSEQANIDAAMRDYQQEQNYPWQQLSNWTGVLNAAPFSTTLQKDTTTTKPGVPTTGFFQQAAGLGIAGIGQGFGGALFRGQ